MNHHSPNKTITVACGAIACLKQLAAVSRSAPQSLFAIFGHHQRPSFGFNFQNAREWFVIQDPPKNLYNDVHGPLSAALSIRLFFGARKFLESHDCNVFFEKIDSIHSSYLLVSPFVLSHELKSHELFLAYGWQSEVMLTSRTASENVCEIKVTSSCSELDDWTAWIHKSLASPAELLPNEPPRNVRLSSTKKEFADAVQSLQLAMKKGDAYLVNLALQAKGLKTEKDFTAEHFAKSLDVETLRYFSFVKTDEIGILSYSPERFIKICDGIVLTEPIKGTKALALIDDASVAEGCHFLWSSEKEMNEQCMVVDLLRNDLNRVSLPGSVGVCRPFTIYRIGKLLQMQTSVFGQLTTKQSLGQVLKNMLPAGSISGTPKLEVCKLIANHESTKRGYFTGVLGVYDVHQNNNFSFESCLLIRSHFHTSSGVYAGAGCGLTTLSNPDDEFHEIEHKLRSFSEAFL